MADLAKLAHQCGASLPSFADVSFVCFTSFARSGLSSDFKCSQYHRYGFGLPWTANHLQKTVAVLIQPPTRVGLTHQNASNLKIFLQGQELKFVEETRLLGIMIDNRLPWSAQIPQSAVKSEERLVPLNNATNSWHRCTSLVLYEARSSSLTSSMPLLLALQVCLNSSATASWSFGAELCAVPLVYPTKAMSKFFWLNIPWLTLLSDGCTSWPSLFDTVIVKKPLPCL